ncbi:hypothetical protein RFI_17108 [Reticulomyxa filosa]|uniref:Heat shock protein 70 n=1 Tax=Reticulomyxa filosa TaxID=46433 RepID=X6N1Z2_RETFI|nr:hypothetical protein RFI_17108 [Reticulomyxa filosa]|eukprot:ETO20106.1 hypothetical protein RFI_17108 [Reticulomyxa filosa]
MYILDVAGQYQTKLQPTLKKDLQATNGTSINTEIVFVGALKYCKQKAMQYFTQHHIDVDEEKIQWVITVPAIWSEEAKGLMKRWAKQASLWSPSIPNQLMIALEPECASMCVMLEMKDNLNTTQFKTGDCYMMMDLGAGTADMVCHEIIGPFEVREMIASFIVIFQHIFGEQRMHDFRAMHPKFYLRLLENIENSKHRFFSNKKTTGVHRIEIPYEFDQYMQEKIGGNLEEVVSNFEYLGESGFVLFIYIYVYMYIYIHTYMHIYIYKKIWFEKKKIAIHMTAQTCHYLANCG